MNFKRAFGLLSLVMTTSGFSALAIPRLSGTENIVTEISVTRGIWSTNRPMNDSVVLRSDGTAQYIGITDVEKIGTFTGKISPRDFARLAELIPPLRRLDRHANDKPRDNAPLIWTTVAAGGNGLEIMDSDGQASPQIWGFEMAIFGVASQIEWKKVEMKGSSGVWGQATTGSTRQVERIGERNSAPKSNVLLVVQTAEGKNVARVTTSKDGSFEVALTPGDYVLVSGDKTTVPKIGGTEARFTVEKNRWTKLAIDVDTGIR